MVIRFWGVRGSVPTPQSSERLRKKIKEILRLSKDKNLTNDAQIESFINSLPFHLKNNFGGNTTCIEIIDDEKNIFIIDAGTGIKSLSNDLLKRTEKQKTFNLFFTHFHWDHIQGFPFFVPAYFPLTNINFFSTKNNFHKILQQQQNPCYFPKKIQEMESKKKFIQLKANKPIKIGNTIINSCPMNHPGGGTAYSFTNKNKKVVITGDVEFEEEDILQINKFGDFFKNADIAIFDSQYSLEESFSKFDWGHTTYSMAINLAVNWKIKKLILSHHEPDYSDSKIMSIEKLAKEHVTNLEASNIDVIEAYEGLKIEI